MFRKVTTLLTAIVMMLSLSTVVFAETTTVTTTVPGASYTLSIPATVSITYGATSTESDGVLITNSSGFQSGKYVYVKATYDALSSTTTQTTIPYKLLIKDSTTNNTEEVTSGGELRFDGKSDGTCRSGAYIYKNHNTYYADKLMFNITNENWGKADSGDYTSTITFTSRIAN